MEVGMDVRKTKKEPAHSEKLIEDPRFKLVDRTLKRVHFQQDALIEVLHTAQEAFGFLSDELMTYVAHQLKLPLSWVYGVATFYHFFSLEPQGEHTCVVCMGTACYVKRAAEIVSMLQDEYHIAPGETTSDGKLSLATARCLGSCGLAPVLVLDNVILGREKPHTAVEKVSAVLLDVSETNMSAVSVVADKAGLEAEEGRR